MKLVFFGAPGAGKGTIAKMMMNDMGIVQISTGDLFRKAIKDKTELGQKVSAILAAGDLVPDALTIAIVDERVKEDDCKNGYILDGFPRTLPQAKALSDALSKTHSELDAVLVMEVPEEELIIRTTGRRLDTATGEIYHIKYKPPPAEIVKRLTHREDDHEEIVLERLKKYQADTTPVLPYYEKLGLVQNISGMGTPSEIKQRITEALQLVTSN